MDVLVSAVKAALSEKKKKKKKKRRGQKKKKKSGGSSSSTSSDSESPSSSGGDDDKGNAGGLKGIIGLRREYRRHPEKFLVPYVKHCKEVVGVVNDQQQFQLADYSRRIRRQFGRMVGLWRCHLGIQQALQLIADKDTSHGTAYLVQLSKAIHQVALDGGSWENAQHLLPSADALEDPSFGGLEGEMLKVQRYRRAIKDLLVNNEGSGGGLADDFGKKVEDPKKKKGKGKGQEKEAD